MNKKNIMPILLAVFIIAAISGWGVVIYQYNEIKNRDDEIAKLSEKTDTLDKQVEDLTAVDDPYANFIKTDNWEVMFPYTDGVTKVKAEVGNDGDGSLLIKSIEKEGKTYDVNLCGGESHYSSDEPFFFGKVVRWKRNGEHKEGAEDPKDNVTKYSLIYTTNTYDYYYQFNMEQGCKTGENESYEEGVLIASNILNRIRIKEQ